MTLTTAELGSLSRADGSATYSADGYTIIGAVNGPIEVQRRDELPEEAAIEVNIRPAVGVGSTKERHLESVIHSTLRRLILTRSFPRTLIQVTLQVVTSPEQFETKFSHSVTRPATPGAATNADAEQNLPILPALLQATVLTLLSASLPLDNTFTSSALAIVPGSPRSIVPLESKVLARASSVHVFAFISTGALLLSESEGSFSIEDWEDVHDRARDICCGGAVEAGAMDVDGQKQDRNVSQWVKSVVKEKAEQEQGWKS